uniref:Uncharacterized protein n=1 Tax=Sus scrofa TaxID=9823 RepID=A0A4X1UJS3_PIG
MLAISFISAVNRKRKKRREARGLGSSTDDDSEQEAHKPEEGAPAPGAQDRPKGQLPGAALPEAPGRLNLVSSLCAAVVGGRGAPGVTARGTDRLLGVSRPSLR